MMKKEELARGRAFGSDGDEAASEYLADQMGIIGLVDKSKDGGYREQIKPEWELIDKLFDFDLKRIRSTLEINSMTLEIQESGEASYELEDMYISPYWRYRVFPSRNTMEYTSTGFIKVIPPPSESFEDAVYDMLTDSGNPYGVAFENVDVFYDYLSDTYGINSFLSFFISLVGALEEYYVFDFTCLKAVLARNFGSVQGLGRIQNGAVQMYCEYLNLGRIRRNRKKESLKCKKWFIPAVM